MNRRRFFPMLAASVAPLLGGCSSVDFRYKLTLALKTRSGIKSGYSVVNNHAFESSFPIPGGGSIASGESVFVDLGEGRRPLIATMARTPDSRDGRLHWGDGKVSTLGILNRLGFTHITDYGHTELLDQYRLVRQQVGKVIELQPRDLPPLITFGNINDPGTVEEVDPNDLADALRQDVSWHRITIEITREPVTRGIEKKLPWFERHTLPFHGRVNHRPEDTRAQKMSTAILRWR
jgi:hypothetical protein